MKMDHSRPRRGVVFLASAMIAALLLPPTALAETAPQDSLQTVPQSREQVTLSFAPIVKQTAPAVVNVYSRKVVKTREATSPLFNDPFFRQFFQGQLGVPQERVQRSLGSGVIVRPNGLVVTNYHVIGGSDEITVVLSDRREFEAKVVSADEKLDLAVLRIEVGTEKLPTLPIGDSDGAEVGDIVLAVGNPFGVGQTVTQGIISAVARTNVGVNDFQSFIQTDAAINPGNSGGALVDMHGRLIGINTAIYSKDGGSNGIGFAIPTTMVQAVLTAATTGGKIVRPWLGVSGQQVAAENAAELGLDKPRGVLLSAVAPGGPGERAGLKLGDVVLAVQGHEIDDPKAMRFRLATLPVGSSADLHVWRRGHEEQLKVKVEAPPETPARNESEIGGRNPFSGATVANINPALADEIGLEGAEHGVVVLRLKPGTIANRLQFQPGDVILKVNGRIITQVADLQKAVEQAAPRWEFAIERDGQTLNLVIGG